MSIAVSITVTMKGSFDSFHARDFSVGGQSLGYDLIHVVVLIRRQTTYKCYSGSSIRQGFVFRVDCGIFFSRNRVIRITFCLGKLVHDAGSVMLLASQILKFGDARVWLLVRIIDYRC